MPFAERTLPALLVRRAALGERAFIRSGSHCLTYAEAPRIAARCAGALAMAGVRPGDRVAAFCTNRIELLHLWLGTAWLGAVLVPINTAFRGDQLRHLLRLASPVALLGESALLPALRDVVDALAPVNSVWVCDLAPQAMPGTLGRCPVQPWTGEGVPVAAHPVTPGDPVAVLYTSGTSGPSKAVLCPHAQFYWWGVLTARALGVTADDVLHTTLPLFHTNALNTLWQALVRGATYSFVPGFSASRYWDEVAAAGATALYLLGAMVHILMKAPPGPADRAHRARVALSPATAPELVDAFRERFGVRVVEGYGSTETNLVFANVGADYVPGAMGRVVDEFEVQVVDAHDCELPPGIPGELLVRQREPFSMFTGYLGNPEATVAAWRNLWFHTGDRVVAGPDGVYRFLDRLKDSIRRRGENISSWEVEQALLAHPAIENAAAIGVPSELGEEDVMAYVVCKAGASVTPDDLTRFLIPRLAYFAIPRFLEFLPELPETENGKVKKFALRALGPGPRTWDLDASGIVLRPGPPGRAGTAA